MVFDRSLPAITYIKNMPLNKMPHKFVTIDSETNSLNDDLACEITRLNEKITMTFTGFKSEEEIMNFYNVQLLLWSAESLPEKLN